MTAGHRIRSLGLLVAVWALLLAPGALGEDGRSVPDIEESEHLAAAVLAPTLGSESFVTGRSSPPVSDGDVQSCRSVGGPVPAPATPTAVELTTALRRPVPVEVSGDPGRPSLSRAPPSL